MLCEPLRLYNTMDVIDLTEETTDFDNRNQKNVEVGDSQNRNNQEFGHSNNNNNNNNHSPLKYDVVEVYVILNAYDDISNY